MPSMPRPTGILSKSEEEPDEGVDGGNGNGGGDDDIVVMDVEAAPAAGSS